jgi:outer membrane protein
MKIKYRTLAALAAVFLATSLPALADTKIAVVRLSDLMQAAQSAPGAKANMAKAEADFAKRADDLRAQEKRLADDSDKFKRDSVTMTKEQAEKTGRDLNARQSDLKFQEDQFQRDYENKRQDLGGSLQETVKAAVVLVAKEKGIDLVMPAAIYATPSLDITEDVMKRLAAPVAGK